MPKVVDLASLGTNGFLIQGAAQIGFTGMSLATAGDLNGDGFDDIIIGAPYLNGQGGSAYVIYGHANGFGTIDLANLSAADGFEMRSADSYDGVSVSGAGDVNGDGFDDFIVASSFRGGLGYGDAPRAHVVFGGPARSGLLDLSGLSASDGFLINGPFESAYYRSHSISVSSAGDVNGDGFDDIIIGTQYANNDSGGAYVIFGHPGPFSPINVSNLSASVGFAIQGLPQSRAGVSVSGLGDINGDGLDDFIVGDSYGDLGGSNAGQAYVIYGRTNGFSTIDLAAFPSATTPGFIIQGAGASLLAGRSVSAAGDVNGDGYQDIIVGTGGVFGAGQAYVIFGGPTRSSNIDLANLPASAGFIIQGAAAGDEAGFSVSAAGDVNRDGFGDLIVGAPQNDAGGTAAGASYVIFGHAGTFGTVNLASLSPAAGFVIQGANAGDIAGQSVSTAGDFNGDGLSDVLTGAPFGDLGGFNAGQAYVVFGMGNSVGMHAGDFNGDGRDDILWRNNAGTVTNWLGTATGSFTGNFANANLNLATNWQVAGIGDFNGDHRDDILWRDQAGTVTNWLSTTAGGFNGNFANANVSLDNDWKIAGIGDFNGDHRDDILWRNTDGSVTDWLSTASGGFTANLMNANVDLSTNWHVAGIGDFNGDHIDDILWRDRSGTVTDWLGNANGGFTGNFANANASLAAAWQVIGTGDFNGDGRDDILWRDSAGTVAEWLGTLTGGFTANPSANVSLPMNWQVTAIGDFNGDHIDDVLWRDANGTVTDWLGTATGAFNGNFAAASLSTPGGWHTEPHPHVLI